MSGGVLPPITDHDVVGRNLCGVEVHEDRYPRRAAAAVRAHIPAHLWLPEPRRVDAGKEPVPAAG